MSNEGTYREANPVRRYLIRQGASATTGRVLAPGQRHIDRVVFGITRGRHTLTSLVLGWPIVMLTTVGAKSGARRTLPLVGMRDGDRMVVIASSYGRPDNPAWFYNLRAHPRASMTVAGGASRPVRAYEAEGAERERLWARALEFYPGWAEYEKRVARRIPVMVLTPESA
ncbi:nitroreductase/quinone reductase family protein [Rhodococcus sp. W8901]|uniref:nitroreductase/quinone reductase family protein n=1 Tax=Rhodococcus sp. W8901 TaxID=2742603 RepID=UPI0015819B7B|nr:nitroreductase/quinone reductase family protein [Rhodococcus sp. W8901]QKT12186.1 nitroreductase family deazaflavin-dependent oxidoreductase [Rhodococcus sp. W8901]